MKDLVFSTGILDSGWRYGLGGQARGDSLDRCGSLDGAIANGSTWSGADFTGAMLTRVDFRYANFGTGVADAMDGISAIKSAWLLLTGRLVREGSRIYGPGVPNYAATFAAADLTGAVLEGAKGPNLLISDTQRRVCKIPIDAAECGD